MRLQLILNEQPIMESIVDDVGWTNKFFNTEATITIFSDKFCWCEHHKQTIEYDDAIRTSRTFHLLWSKINVSRIVKIRECD